MNFSEAVEHLKNGGKVRLQGQLGYYFVDNYSECNLLKYTDYALNFPFNCHFSWQQITSNDWEIVGDETKKEGNPFKVGEIALAYLDANNIKRGEIEEIDGYSVKLKGWGFWFHYKQCELVKDKE